MLGRVSEPTTMLDGTHGARRALGASGEAPAVCIAGQQASIHALRCRDRRRLLRWFAAAWRRLACKGAKCSVIPSAAGRNSRTAKSWTRSCFLEEVAERRQACKRHLWQPRKLRERPSRACGRAWPGCSVSLRHIGHGPGDAQPRPARHRAMQQRSWHVPGGIQPALCLAKRSISRMRTTTTTHRENCIGILPLADTNRIGWTSALCQEPPLPGCIYGGYGIKAAVRKGRTGETISKKVFLPRWNLSNSSPICLRQLSTEEQNKSDTKRSCGSRR